MARVNITIPDELLAKARDAGINISRAAAAGLTEELDRLTKVAELENYLQELDRELGSANPEEQAEARRWVDGLLQALPER